MSTHVNVILVDGKKITESAELSQMENGALVRIKAVKGAKILFTSGKNGAVNEHIVVKRNGKNLQVFLNENDEQPQLIIEDYSGSQVELAGMGNDGQYHTFVTENGDSQAFMSLQDGSAIPLLMSSAATGGLSGLSLASTAASGMSMGWMIAGAIGGLLAIGGIAAAAGGGSGDSSSNDDGDDHPTAPSPTPINMNDFVLTDSVGSLAGPVSAGGVTDDARPIMSGSGTPGNTVRIYDNGKLIGTTIIDASGRWQWQSESNLAAGKHDLSFSEMNRDGVESERSEGFGFELDLTAPARATDLTLVDSVGTSQGPVSAGDTINDSSPALSGKAEAGATVEIRDNGELIGTVLVGADGSWTFIPSPALNNGEHNFSVVVVDPAGNKGLPVSLGPIIVDDTLVDVPAFSKIADGNGDPLLPGGSLNTNPLMLGGQGTPGDIVTIIRNGQPAGSLKIGENGEWQYELQIPDAEQGDQSIGLIVTSPTGEELGRSDAFDFEFDNIAPDTPSMADVSVTDGNGNPLTTDSAINVRDVVFSGTADEGDMVRLYNGDQLIGSVVVGADGTWSIPVSGLDEGNYDFRTEIEDKAGNVSGKSDSFELEVDLTPPVLGAVDVTNASGNPVASGDAVNSELTFSGKGDAGDTVYLWDGNALIGSVKINSNGYWSLVAAMTEERDYAFQTEVRDPADNSSGKSTAVAVTYDITPPDAVAIGSVEKNDGNVLNDGDYSNDNKPVFRGTGIQGDTVYLIDNANGQILGSAMVDANGDWKLTPESELDDGTLTLRVDVADPAGNIIGGTDSISLIVDTKAPDVAQNLTLEDAFPTLSGPDGSVEANSLVIIKEGDAVVGSVRADANGKWTWQPDSRPGSGDFVYSVVVQDAAGNLNAKSSGLGVNITLTDFSNNDFDGWLVKTDVSDDYFQTGGQLYINTPSNGGVDYSGDLLWKDIYVKAGEVYNFSFDVFNTLDRNNPILGVSIDGQTILAGESIDTIKQWLTLNASWTATADGYVRIALFNDQTEEGGNDFYLDNLNISHQYTPIESTPYNIDQGLMSINLNEIQLDFSQLSFDAETVNHISLEGHGNNTLTLSLADVLSLGDENLFLDDGAKQMMITGDAGDVVNLSDMLPDGVDTGDWNMAGDVTVGGMTYQVYQHSGLDADVLVQQNVIVNLDNH